MNITALKNKIPLPLLLKGAKIRFPSLLKRGQGRFFPLRRALAVLLAFLILISGVLIFYHPSAAQAAWFDDNWSYRTGLTIGNTGSADSNKKVKFDIDTATLITAGKMQSDCGDSRFTDINGKALRYFIDTAGGACNGASTDYYVLVPEISAGNTAIYHYYGNPAAANGTESAQFSEATFSPTSGPTADTEEKAPSPALYLKFDENYGTTTQDQSPNKNNGSISGAGWKEKQFCLSENCLFFDGVDDIVTVTNADSIDMDRHLAGALTFQAWVRPNGAGEGTGGQIFYKGANTWLRVDTLSNGKLDIEASLDLATDATLNVSSAIDSNNWNFVALSYTDDGDDEITIWVNGKNVGSSGNGVGAPAAADTNNFLIGGTTTNNFQGFIDEVKIYPIERTDAQIKTDAGLLTSLHGVSASFGDDQSYLSEGLAGYWKLDETATPAVDSSGNGNSGTWTGSPSGRAGKFNNAISINASGDYISAADSSSLSITGSLTITTWASPSANMNMANKALVVKDGSYRIATNASSQPLCQINNGTSWQTAATSTTALSASTWQNVACVYDQRTIRIFLNGEQKDSQTVTAAIADTANALRIGSDAGGTYTDFFQGGLDDVRVYKRAFSDREVRSLYDWGPGPVGWWKFDERDGTSAYDISGNANTGTLTNGPVWTAGKIGQALNFDNIDDIVIVPSSASISNMGASGGFSIATWIRPRSEGEAGAGGRIVRKSVATGSLTDGWEFRMSSTNAVIFTAVYSPTPLERKTANNAITLNAWNYVVMTWNGSAAFTNVHIYVNGTETGYTTETNGASSQTGDSNGNLVIGNSENTARTFDGPIDDVRIYNYARTPKQIIQDMNAGHPAVGSPVGSAVGHWSFDEGYGTTANDKSPLSNDLTLSAASWTNHGKLAKAWNGTGAVWLTRADDDDFDFAATDDLSLAFWFKSDSGTNPSNAEYLLEKGTITNTGTAGYAVYANTSGNIVFGVKDDGAWGTSSPNTPSPDDTATSTTDIYDNTWHHIVATKTGTSRIDLYVDGKSNASNTSLAATATLANAIALRAGDDDADAANSFNGDIDETKIYRYALNADEVKIEYNQGKSVVFGALSTNPDGTTATNSAARSYCPPGNTETNCAAGSDPSPVGHWTLDERTGTSANDSSGNNNTGTLTNGPTWTIGKYGAGLSFAGSDAHVTRADDSDFDFGAGASFTYSTWIKHDTASAQQVILSKYDGAAGEGGYKMIMESDGDLTCAIDFDNTWTPSDSATSTAATYDDNLWHYVSCVKDANSSLTLYIDGIFITSDSSISASTTLANSDPLYIGIDADGTSNDWVGQLDDVKIYNYVRTPAQIAWEYNRGSPVALYKFDECQGSTAYDSGSKSDPSASRNDATITVGATGSQTSAGNCTTAASAWYKGKIGKFNSSLSLDGTDDYAATANIAPIAGNSFTYSALSWGDWVLASTSAASKTILHKNKEFKLTTNASSRAVCAVDISAGAGFSATTAVSTTALPLGSWNHLLCTYDGTNIRAYVNGRLETTSSTVSGSITSTNTTALSIGRDPAPSGYFEGLIDEARIYNYALNATQIRTLYNENSAVRFGPLTGSP